MAQLKHIPNNIVLGRYLLDKVTPVNPPICQNKDSNHCTFMNVSVLMPNDGNKGYKIDKSSERFGV